MGGGDHPVHHLVIVLGDQLDRTSAAFDGFDRAHDMVFMAELDSVFKRVRTHKAKIALVISAMRHFREQLQEEKIGVQYWEVNDALNQGDLARMLVWTARIIKPMKIIVVEPSEYWIRQEITSAAGELGLEMEIRPDRHFFCSTDDFHHYTEKHKHPRLDSFYREMRKRYAVLVENNEPIGGSWQVDKSGSEDFGKQTPPMAIAPIGFPPDSITHKVIEMVKLRYDNHPGTLEGFDWPVTDDEAETAMEDFLIHRLPHYGTYENAMWKSHNVLFHSRLSAAMNLKLLDPKVLVRSALNAYTAGRAPLISVEPFIRQILGWREYARGIYWMHMPAYVDKNEFSADAGLPDFFRTGLTDMKCLRTVIQQTIAIGYSTPIQRQLVIGMFGMLLGINPKEMHEWFLAMYVDGAEWVEMPNTIGRSQFADGGLMAGKPYCTSGKYIEKVGNYCEGCTYKPDKATGNDACPFTTLYWHYLLRNREKLGQVPTMADQLDTLRSFNKEQLDAIRFRANQLRSILTASTRPAQMKFGS